MADAATEKARKELMEVDGRKAQWEAELKELGSVPISPADAAKE